jgi:hypothetical protein
VWEQPHIADMVSMRVRYRDKTDVAGPQSDLGKYIFERPVEVIDNQFRSPILTL